ncbi:RNA-directed DNA polymerase (Reverse transcriptase) [Trifolium medium]|uniref:RNA-directed DNA polymerase (Reverse transcriptase) n=1 Tax=Trifolium medium TaxID=97028 RepID=A0A392S4E1_9FABA|nr:RNA-directed DNA polymerase (Reverse transcriptase) [Trifolium medium]
MQDPITVSHLQFVDDTLLLGTKSWENVRALQTVLVLFELMSGLKRLCYGGKWERCLSFIWAFLLRLIRGVWVFGNRC